MWQKIRNYFKEVALPLKSFPMSAGRSLPTNSYNFIKYFNAYMKLLIVFTVYNLINIMFVRDDFQITFPVFFWLAIPIIFFHVYGRIENNYRKVDKDDMKKVIVLIRLRHSQLLEAELNEKPEVLKKKYKNKSLIYWAKHYNNVQAHSIIAKLTANRSFN